jgi:hypothetical protein
MAESTPGITQPRSFMTDMPAAGMSVGLALMQRRSSALVDFWRSFAEVRQPTDLMAMQLNYWTQLVDDYQDAFTEGLSQFNDAAGRQPPAAGDGARAA